MLTLALPALPALATGGEGAARQGASTLAATPPMGWNSWDAYGFTIDEAQFKANASVLAGLAGNGWHYAVIDEGWYMEEPRGKDREARHYVVDADGLLIPAPSRFPSSTGDKGFRPLADWLHARGLALGLHVVRGIPKAAVMQNLPIADSPYRAADAADTSDLCSWDDGNYGVADNAAGQDLLRLDVAALCAMGRRFRESGLHCEPPLPSD